MNLFRRKNLQSILKDIDLQNAEHGTMGKHLGVRDLTAFGIAAIIGAGIFSTIGNASASGGPGVVLLFIFTAMACTFAAFAYAEFASMVPASGSAYTYSYIAFGEIIAWIIGWALLMEYGIGNITIAISWSDYFTTLMHNFGWDLPAWSTMDIVTAYNGYHDAEKLIQAGTPYDSLQNNLKLAHSAYHHAPQLGGLHIVADIPALCMIIFITWLVYRGMQESRNASNIMVVVKLAIVLLVIAVGLFYVNKENWDPFLPNGIPGVLKGVAAVFFAYIGFDAISTTAEECKNPQRDLPRSMFYSISICTVLYIIIALVLTGMVNYRELGVGDPLAFVFEKVGIKWMSFIISISAVVAMASVFLVFQIGQPRIWMSMSRDGLLPKKFSAIHSRFKTPWFATIITGFVVAIPALFLNLNWVTDVCSIGTLFAFVLVCAGVLKIQIMKDAPERKFKTPYINARFFLPVILVFVLAAVYAYNGDTMKNFLLNTPRIYAKSELITNLDKREIEHLKYSVSMFAPQTYAQTNNDVQATLENFNDSEYEAFLKTTQLSEQKKYESGWKLFKHKIPMWIFILVAIFLLYMAIRHNLSLIPLLGLLSCLYMMCEMSYINWLYFSGWLIIGLVIYFAYGYSNSKLNTKNLIPNN